MSLREKLTRVLHNENTVLRIGNNGSLVLRDLHDSEAEEIHHGV